MSSSGVAIREGGNLLTAARTALARGDLVSTYDLAYAGLAARSDGAAYLLVLSLARMGDTDAAKRQYRALGLDRAPDVDTRALWARLAKDEAAGARGTARRDGFREASAAYAAIHRDTGNIFPGINAASTAFLAGDLDDARRLAADVLRESRADDDFWACATRAEALLLLGREADAADAIAAAMLLPGSTAGTRATTLRQFDLLAGGAGLDPGGQVRAALLPPETICFCGHMFLAGPAVETALAARIDAELAARRVGVAFGALACGADILVAERLIARGGELNVVLPFDTADFLSISVDPGGHEWRPRFERCLAAAASLHVVSHIGYIGDPQAFRHASRVAMGLARLRARQHGGRSTLFALWDGTPARGAAGTALDVAAWEAAHGDSVILAPDGIDRRLDRAKLPAAYDGPPRAVQALIFADVPGFTTIPEIELPHFWREVMGTIATVLDRYGDAVRSRNSWGDAIFVVVDSVAVAAEIVVSLQQALARVGSGASLRIGAHYGPVFSTLDPITRQPTFYGQDVSRTARIEPVTPPGQAYVTESFAAALAMDAPDAFRCFYVGQVALAKGFGTFPMYRLDRSVAQQDA